jgi:hypothetical protein
MKEVTPQWDEIMRLAAQIKFGQIVIKIHNSEVLVAEYTITRKKGEEVDEFKAFPL